MKSIPNDKAKVAVAKALDSDACASTFAMTVRAEVYHKSAASTAIGWAECVVSVQVQDANERPIIVKSSSDARRIVEEGAMPGTYVGTPLEAVDEEVSAGVQQLVWEMTSCRKRKGGFPRSFGVNLGFLMSGWTSSMVRAMSASMSAMCTTSYADRQGANASGALA